MKTSTAPTMNGPAKMERAFSRGDVISGKYRIEGQIGSGGMGVVLSATHIAMGHRLAIKILRLDEKDADHRGAVMRFVREARAAARIESDHVVRVTDVAALPDGTPFMVMEYLDGEDLRGLLHRRRQIPIEEAVGYVLQACEGLAEAHASGVIHRDLKPSNLFLAKKANGTTVLKVLDFGISKVIPRKGEIAMTTTSALMGSPLYMAPEQMRSSKDVDARSDIWSLGIILYELLAGVSPFEGESIPEVCVNVMGGEPLALSRFRNDVPNELQSILLRCMEKDREKRYPTMGALARALEHLATEQARVHADRASEAMKAARQAMVTAPDEEYGVLPNTQEGVVEPPGPPDAGGFLIRADPEALPSWSTGRAGTSRSKWVVVGVATSLAAAILGAFVARGNPPREVPATHGASAPIVAPAPPPSPEPVAKGAVPSVPFESLPVAARDAGGVRAAAQPPRRSPAPPPSGSAQKDDWKWGDRN